MTTTKINPSDTHVLHVGLAVDAPWKLIFCIEDADTRAPIAWVKLDAEGAMEIANCIPKLIEELKTKH